MKIKKHQSPSKTTITNNITKPTYSAILELELETKQDIAKSSLEINKFIDNDLGKHTIYVMKHA